ncbi:MAG: hypothetical protein Q9182_007557, partial [Xanthomendoza sp. 2 TL-2023]
MSPEAGIFQSAQGQWKYDEAWFDNVHDWTISATEDESKQTLTWYKDFFVVHDCCMVIVEKFIYYQGKFPSPKSPKLMKELIDMWCTSHKPSLESRTAYAARAKGSIPLHWAVIPNVDHFHLYFGARRFWTDPWDCVPGYEYLCSDPIQESQTAALLSTWLTRSQPYSNCLFSSSAEALESSKEFSLSQRQFMHFPQEIHDLIISQISLKDALSFYSSSRKLSRYCNSTFWRSQTMRLHPWLWELRDPNFIVADGSWKELLQLLTINRSQIQREAEPYWYTSTATNDDENENRSPDIAEPGKMSLPLGLKNRQRIWMCLESWGTKAPWEVEAVQHEKFQGQRK